LTWLGRKNDFRKSKRKLPGMGSGTIPDATTAILKERTLLSQRLGAFHDLEKDLEEAGILLDLGIEEADADTMAEVSGQISKLGRRLHQFSWI
jgi:peptide chain release factor 2